MIITKSLAPYRNELYRAVAEALEGEMEVILVAPEESAPDHNWSELVPDGPNLSFQQIACRFHRSRLLAKFYQNHEVTVRVPLPSRQVATFLSECQADVVWVHESSPYVHPAVKWALKNKRLLLASTEVGARGRGNIPKPLELMHRRLFKKADLAIGNTRDAFETVRHEAFSAVFAPHAVRKIDSVEKESTSCFRFLYVGNLIKRKGVDLILEACKQLQEAGKQFEVTLVGGGSEQDYGKAIAEMGLGAKVHLAGFLEGEALQSAYHNADCLLLPSRYDTYAVVVHEAARAGLALIVSSATGASEVLVEEGKNGYVIEPEVESLRLAMGRALDGGLVDAEVISRRLANEFSVENSAQKIANRILDLQKPFGHRLDFLIVGAQKAASTFLHRALLDHPDIFLPPGEINFFEGTIFDEMSREDCQDLFRERRGESILGIKRPDYLALPEVPARVREHSPESKILMVLRNPVDRAISAYYHYIAGGYIPALDPNEGLSRLLDNSLGDYPAANSLLSYGRYAQAWRQWAANFPGEQITVKLQEDIIENPRAVMKETYRLLGVDDTYVSKNIDRRSQAVVYHLGRARLLGKIHHVTRKWHADGMNHTAKFGGGANLPWWSYLAIDRFILSRIFGNQKAEIAPEVKERLIEYYREDIEELAVILKRDLSHWLS